MQIGYVSLPGRGATDACLAAAVARLRARGMRLAGTVQTNPPHPSRSKCDMDLAVLPDGPVLRISQDLGEGARGCRLDGGALEQAVVDVLARLDGAEMLVINKFGKQEAVGRGLVPAIAEGLERGLPVLVGVNALNLDGFLAFAGDMAVPLPPDPASIAHWMSSQVARRVA